MTDIVKTGIKDDFERYAELLARRDTLRREADACMTQYIHEFGGEITEIFSEKVESIRLRKCIAYAQREANRGRKADPAAMQTAVDAEMTPYYHQLDEMAAERDRCRDLKYVTQGEALQVKKLYRELTKQLHPDLNPETEKNGTLLDLWNRIVAAAHKNDLAALQELQVLVTQALHALGAEGKMPEIPDIAERIAKLEKEIAEIISTDPYRFRDLLGDPDAVKAKHAELTEELAQWQSGRKQLEDMLKELMGGTQWQMN